MGGKRGRPSASKKMGGQMRLDDLLKPRRSSRLSSADKNKSTSKKVKTDLAESQVIEISDTETGTGNTVTLVSTKIRKEAKETGQRQEVKEKHVAKEIQQKVKKRRNKEDDQALLRDFDFNCMYGPCRGISRRERYERAIKYNCRPPPNPMIIEMLNENQEEMMYQKWYA